MPEQGTLGFGSGSSPAPEAGAGGSAPATRGGRRVILAAHPRRVLPALDGFDAVLVPNDRAGRAVAARSRVSGEPVRWRTIEKVARRALRDAAESNAPRTLASVLQERRFLRQAVRDVLAPDDLEGTVRTWGPTVREVLRAGFGTESAAALEAPSARSRQVLDVAVRYRERLREAGLLDRADLMWVAADAASGVDAGAARRQRVLVAGYPRVGLGELAFLDAFAADGSVVVFPAGGAAGAGGGGALAAGAFAAGAFTANEEAAAYLAARGWSVERPGATPVGVGERWSARLAGAPEDDAVEGRAPDPEARALRFPDQEAEVRGVLGEVKALLLDGAAPDTVTLIARDEALYGPLVRAVAQEYGVPVRLSYAVPLRETRLGAWLGDLLEGLRSGFPFEPTARLLRHPLNGRLDDERWARARATHPHGLEAWTALVPEAQALAWPRRAERGVFVERLERAWDGLGVTSALADLPELAVDRRAERRVRLALTELRSEAETGTREAFLAELDDVLSGLSVPLDPPPPRDRAGREGERGPRDPSVALHTPLAVYGARYRHVFVLGMAEGLTPAAVRDDPVLDFFERTRLRAAGVPVEGAAEAAERELLSFWAALETAEARLTLSFPELVAGSARVPSPYFERLGLEPGAAAPRSPASRMEARAGWLREPDGAPDDPVAPHARAAWQVERRRESAEPWDVFDGVVGVPLDPDGWPFSASQLTSLGQCAFRWFAQRRLRLAVLEEAEEEVSPLLRGRLYHEALALCLGHARDADDPRAAALEHLDQAFAEAEAIVGVPAQASWPIRRPYHLEVLRRVLQADDFFPSDGRIVSLEQRFHGAWRGLRVTGFVDRVDDGADGLVLLDYKTRASKPDGAKDRAGKARLDVQLPLYVEAAAPALYPGEPVADARYYSLTKARTLTRAKIDDDELTAFVARVREHLRCGSYPVDPDVDAKACAHCDFDAVCRRGPRLERKRQGGAE